METQWNADRIAEITGIPWDPVGTATRSAQQDQEPQKVEEEIDGTALDAPTTTRGMPVLQKHLRSSDTQVIAPNVVICARETKPNLHWVTLNFAGGAFENFVYMMPNFLQRQERALPEPQQHQPQRHHSHQQENHQDHNHKHNHNLISQHHQKWKETPRLIHHHHRRLRKKLLRHQSDQTWIRPKKHPMKRGRG